MTLLYKAEPTDNLLLVTLLPEPMEAILASQMRIEEDIRDIKLRLASLEQGHADGYGTMIQEGWPLRRGAELRQSQLGSVAIRYPI